MVEEIEEVEGVEEVDGRFSCSVPVRAIEEEDKTGFEMCKVGRWVKGR